MEKKTTAATELAAQKKKGMGGLISKISKRFAKITVAVNTALMMAMFSAATAFADGAPSAGSGSTGSGSLNTNEGVQNFNNIIEFFADWIGRIGLVVAFVGAIMFGLAIKNEDAEAKTRGLMTLASGFVVFAVTKALDMFNITGGSTTPAAAFLF